MATVIYNHREMEYNCRKLWKEQGLENPDFNRAFPDNALCKNLFDKLSEINTYSFDEDYAMDYGMDTLRMYVLFEGYPKDEDDWREGSLEGIYKFLNRLMTLVENSVSATMGIEHNEKKSLKRLDDSLSSQKIRQQIDNKHIVFMKEYMNAMQRSHFHGVVAAFMEYSTNLSQISKKNEICIDNSVLQEFVVMLSPLAPYMSEYLWQRLGEGGSVFDRKMLLKDESDSVNVKSVELAIQINGRTKKVITVSENVQESELPQFVAVALGEHMPQNILRVVYVAGKVYNMITE